MYKSFAGTSGLGFLDDGFSPANSLGGFYVVSVPNFWLLAPVLLF